MTEMYEAHDVLVVQVSIPLSMLHFKDRNKMKRTEPRVWKPPSNRVSTRKLLRSLSGGGLWKLGA